VADPVDTFVQTLFDSIPAWTEKFLSTYYPVLGQAVTQPALYVAMIWVAVKVIRVHAGRDPSDVWPLVRMLLTIVFVFSALNWGGLASQIFRMFSELRDNTASLLMGGKSVTQYLEDDYNKFNTASQHMLSQSMWSIGIVLIGLVLNAVNSALVLAALVLKVSSDLGTALTMLLLPLFAPTFFWSSTRGFGMSWLAAMAKFAFVGILLAGVVVFSFSITDQFVAKMDPNTMTARDASVAIVIEAAIVLFMAFGVRPLASALTSSGAAGGGMAELVGGFMMSQLLSKLTGGGKGGGDQNPGQTLNNISNTQAQQGAQLERIERSLSSGGSGGNGGGMSSGQPSGAGQPGGPGGDQNTASSEGSQW
jgi:type IV secretion system protein VirB6